MVLTAAHMQVMHELPAYVLWLLGCGGDTSLHAEVCACAWLAVPLIFWKDGFLADLVWSYTSDVLKTK